MKERGRGNLNPEKIKEICIPKRRIKIFEQSKLTHGEIATLHYFFILVIVVALLVGDLASGACNASGSAPEVRVGSELEFPPYAFVDENGQPAGFSVELIKAVTNAMGLSIKISTGPWDAMWSALVSGKLDVLPVVANLPGRQHLVDFSLPHTETYDAFFVRRGDSSIENIAAAQGMEIVVMRSDAAHHAMLERNFQGDLILVDTIPAGLKLISSGKHDSFLCSKLIGTLSIKEHGIKGLTAGPLISDYKRVFSFAVKKGDAELLEKLNQGLLIIKTSGEYGRIYDKWLSFDDPWQKVKKYLLPIIIMVIAIALIAGFWLVTLQLLVSKRTRELAEINEKLRRAYNETEARVDERTAELAQSNQLLQAEIAERKQAEEALRESENLYRSLFENMLNGFAYCRMLFEGGKPQDFIYLAVNDAFESQTGLRNVVGRKVTEIIPGIRDADPQLFEIYGRVAMTGQPERFEMFVEALQMWFWISVYSPAPEHFVAVFDVITERKRAEEKIQASLLEKETMLKEIHHRVKNNLQVISSLLNMQSSYLQDEEAREALRESMARVRTMAMIHTQLYQSPDLARVDFGRFIRDLVGNIRQSYGRAESSVEIDVDDDEIRLGMDASIHCGLIMNELVSNAMKHAFPDGRRGEVNISMKTAGDRFVLKVRDNGIGFPETVDFLNPRSMGLELVNLLVGQINGAIDLRVEGGAAFTLHFPQ